MRQPDECGDHPVRTLTKAGVFKGVRGTSVAPQLRACSSDRRHRLPPTALKTAPGDTPYGAITMVRRAQPPGQYWRWLVAPHPPSQTDCFLTISAGTAAALTSAEPARL